ncbi:hypothetical protein FH975_11780 [Nesterenkonia sp. Hz 6-5]|nr:hypothetical protein [Nesterenkonia haasae]
MNLTSKLSGGPNQEKVALELSWELKGDPISDDYTSSEISAERLFAKWLRKPDIENAQNLRIDWVVLPVGEDAPFRGEDEDFLSFYTWPVHSETGERLNWTQVPVQDKGWSAECQDKGGFIQEFPGWKPSPLQRNLHLPTLLSAIG